MTRFVIIAYEAEFGPPVSRGIRFVKFEPYDPILRHVFEASRLADIQTQFDTKISELRATGKNFVAMVVHVRGSGRKPAGFDRAGFKIEHEGHQPPERAELEAAS